MQRPFINNLDTRRGSLFTQHVFKQNTQLMHEPPPFNQTKEFTKHYRLREIPGDVDSYEPPHNPNTPTVSNELFKRFTDLKDTCTRCKLDMVHEGRFFMVVNTAKQRLLQGFIIPQSNPFCVFFRGKSMAETVQCPDATHAETYMKSFFSIIDEDEEAAIDTKNNDVSSLHTL